MNYSKQNHLTILRLMNKRLIRLDDVFPYFSLAYNQWFLVSCYLDQKNRKLLWGYSIEQNTNPGYDNIIGIIIYFDLDRRMKDYPNEYIRFNALAKDRKNFNRLLNSFDLKARTSIFTIEKEHRFAAGNNLSKIDKKMLIG